MCIGRLYNKHGIFHEAPQHTLAVQSSKYRKQWAVAFAKLENTENPFRQANGMSRRSFFAPA